jgi:hypothetical protein
VSGRIDEIDQERMACVDKIIRVASGQKVKRMGSRTFCFLFDRAKFLLVDFEVHRYGCRFDGDAPLLFVRSCMRIYSFTSLGTGNDTGFGDERVSK